MKEFFTKFTQEMPHPPGMDWLKAFKQRNMMKQLLSTDMEDKRVQNTTTSNIGNWFYKIYTEEISSKFNPAMVANLDETMLTTNHRLLCVVRMDSRYAITPMEKDSEHITFLTTVTVTGETMPPLAIFQLKNLPPSMDELVKNKKLLVSGQKNGWIDKATFKEYCEEIVKFAKQTEDKT